MKEMSNFWDRYGKEKSLWRQRTLFLHHRLVQKKIVSLLKGMDRSIQVMDIGCGDGFFLNLLSQMGFQHIRGIDPSQPMVERCRKRGLPAEHKSLEELHGKEQFDLILLIEVLEHLKDPSVALKKMNMLLRSGGKILLTVPVCDSFLKRYHRFRFGVSKLKQVQDWDYTHLHAFSKKEIKYLLASISFRIEKCLHASNLYPWVGRYGGKKIGEFFQRIDFGGRFGDILIVLTSRQENKVLEKNSH